MTGMKARLTNAAKRLALTSTLGLAACAGTLPPTAPEAVMAPAALPSAQGEALIQGVPAARWWMQLGDERLDALVAMAWRANHDLRIAASRLAAAREGVTVAGAARWPSVGLLASQSHTRDHGQGQSEQRLGANVDLELDLFGRVGHALQAARADEAERARLLQETKRLVLARVVEAYLELRGAQSLRASIEEQLANQQGTLQLVGHRVSAGSAAPAEHVRLEAQLRLTEARVPALLAQERAARNRLATLTGSPLDGQAVTRLDAGSPLRLPTMLVTDEPAQLLRRRPDVAAAERALAAATSRERVAQMWFAPRVSLSALLGGPRAVGELLGLQALIDGGAGAAGARAATAQAQAATAAYERAIASALEEADTAVSTWTQSRARWSALQAAHGLAQESARLARTRYQEGAESLLGVLDAERTALVAREQLVTAQRDAALATARAYVAVAGGLDEAGEAEEDRGRSGWQSLR